MNELDIQKRFYHPVCSQEEIERIFNVKNAQDHLLKLRGDTLVDHMRLFRVYRNMALREGQTWSLEKSFDQGHYHRVLQALPDHERTLCSQLCFGDIFSNDPNGMVFPTPYGPITTISNSLNYFLQFAHLAVMDFADVVPMKVKFNALRIAMRVMLKTEALDFLMDPRGIIPPAVQKAIDAPIPLQMQFIAGHEFAHFILGHISDQSVHERPIYFAPPGGGEDYKPIAVYNNSQQQEFAADLQSLALPEYSHHEREELLQGALLWFGCLELFDSVVDTICPKVPWTFVSHPPAMERYENLLSNLPLSTEFDLEPWKQFPNLVRKFKDMLQEDVSLNIEGYEIYGSCYLDLPNTPWRGRELVDRVDYY